MAQKMTFYCEEQPMYNLIERYGDHLEDMPFESLLAFNAVLASFTLYYSFDKEGSSPASIFQAAVNQVWDGWKKQDPEAFKLCKAFCVTAPAHHIVPVQKGLADAIQCHHDY